MKQTLEEAAKEYASCEVIDGGLNGLYGIDASKYEPFIAGAEWQSNQSLWHEVSEEPKKGEHICVQVGSGHLTSWFATSNIRKDFEDYNVIRWAYVSDLIKPIPN